MDDRTATSFPTLNLLVENGNVNIMDLQNIKFDFMHPLVSYKTTKQHLFTVNTTLKVNVNFTLEQAMLLYFILLFYIFYIHIVKTKLFLGNIPPFPRFIHIIVQNKEIILQNV